ncbi:flagella basal body P-ring formation protein FlgA [Sphingomonas cavernae]|uniref:Flagellar protein n=1 Tax=Sphingomonas cavernae TaxID=2320861 RepID=A0A418WSJ1_9SPHN|nr:flagella basal body P-ring formation protein FlgA [Sphingomonas cavernae]RJF94185.1 flagellar protein [Sphingomonas cavernae]
MTTTVFRHLLLTTALAATSAGHAQAFQNIDQLETVLVSALGAGVGEPGGPTAPIDRRLKLAQCPQAPVFDAPVLGAVAVRCASLGWRIRVPLSRSLTVTAVREETVIRKGDPVELIAGGRFFEVSTQAVAEQDGAPGARIRVRSTPKAAPVFAEVVRAGLVRIPD